MCMHVCAPAVCVQVVGHHIPQHQLDHLEYFRNVKDRERRVLATINAFLALRYAAP